MLLAREVACASEDVRENAGAQRRASAGRHGGHAVEQGAEEIRPDISINN
jgi:hypothetical protein